VVRERRSERILLEQTPPRSAQVRSSHLQRRPLARRAARAARALECPSATEQRERNPRLGQTAHESAGTGSIRACEHIAARNALNRFGARRIERA